MEIAVTSSDTEPEVTYLGKESSVKSVVREISTFEIAFPFVAFCKGGNELIVSNMHYSAEPMEYHLELKERFISWI